MSDSRVDLDHLFEVEVVIVFVGALVFGSAPHFFSDGVSFDFACFLEEGYEVRHSPDDGAVVIIIFPSELLHLIVLEGAAAVGRGWHRRPSPSSSQSISTRHLPPSLWCRRYRQKSCRSIL